MQAAAPTRRWLPIAAALLLAIGFAAGVHHGAAAIRWCALLLLAAYAWQRRSLTAAIVLGMLAGGELGFDRPAIAVQMSIFSDIFLRLIKCIVAPLILGTLVSGIAGHGDAKGLGRVGLKAILYFEIMTTVALAIGWAAISISRAGSGLHLPAAAGALPSVAPLRWQDSITHAFPENLARSIADGQILQVAVFALLFGAALAMLPEQRRAPLVRAAESLSATMFRFTHIVMYFAPVGVFGAMAYTVGHMGTTVLLPLLKLLATLYAALVAFALLGMLPAAVLSRLPLGRLLRAVAAPAGIAFGTATSEAALPLAMENMEAMGVSRRIVSFVIPLGYSFNLDGSALYLALASIFVVQASGTAMPLAQQALLLLTLMLTSKGVAGVPRAGLVVLLGTVSSFHLPVEPVLVLLGIDTLMDMPRTAVNVAGNCLAAAVVARWEGESLTPHTDPAFTGA